MSWDLVTECQIDEGNDAQWAAREKVACRCLLTRATQKCLATGLSKDNVDQLCRPLNFPAFLRPVDQGLLEHADSLGRSSERRREVGMGIAVVVCNYAFLRSRQPRHPRSPGSCPSCGFGCHPYNEKPHISKCIDFITYRLGPPPVRGTCSLVSNALGFRLTFWRPCTLIQFPDKLTTRMATTISISNTGCGEVQCPFPVHRS